MINRLKQHDLVKTFNVLEGNPKWSIITEPLWYIPYALFSPFATVYMYALGLSEVAIGFIISMGMVLQVVFALISGVLTDKWGRKRTTFAFDFLAWCIPCFIWAFAQNFWWFLIAALCNAVYQITNTSWTCLFTEDCPEEHVVNAFTLIQLCGMLSVFVAPLSVILIGEYSLVPVVRMIYLFSGISMGIKFILLYIYGKETTQGIIRMEETKDTPWFELIAGYKYVFIQMLKCPKTLLVLAFMGIVNISIITTSNFFSLYITEDLLLSEQLVAVFPMIRTGVMLVFILCMQGLLNRLSMRFSIILGLMISILSHILLIFAPPQSLVMVIGYTLLEAIGCAIFMPRKDALMTVFVDPKERSRIYALLHMSMIAISAPFGSIIGYLSSLNGIYPFLLNIGLFITAINLINNSKAIHTYSSNTPTS